MAARRITVRVSNPAHRRTKKRAATKRRRRRNPGEQLSFAALAEKQRAKSLGKGRARRSKKGSHRLRKYRSRLKHRKTQAPSSPRFVQGHLDQALKAAQIPRVNLRGKGNAPIVILAGGSSSSSSKPKRKKRSGAKKRSARHNKNRSVRRAARKGGNMAKRSGGKRKSRKRGRKGHRRIRCIPYQRKGKWIARRVNPGIPGALGAALAVLAGAAGGVALSYGADKLGVGSPNQRAIGLVGAGIGLAALGHKFAPGLSASVGAGVGGIGLLRAVQTMLYASPQPVSGLGNGSSSMEDIASAFAQLGAGGSVFDRIGAVYDDVGMVTE
jgi:hypothetical protein